MNNPNEVGRLAVLALSRYRSWEALLWNGAQRIKTDDEARAATRVNHAGFNLHAIETRGAIIRALLDTGAVVQINGDYELCIDEHFWAAVQQRINAGDDFPQLRTVATDPSFAVPDRRDTQPWTLTDPDGEAVPCAADGCDARLWCCTAQGETYIICDGDETHRANAVAWLKAVASK